MKSYRKILNMLSKDIININDLKITWVEVVGVFFCRLYLFSFPG